MAKAREQGLLSPEDLARFSVIILHLIRRHFGALSYLGISC